jgi:hypothetical protein
MFKKLLAVFLVLVAVLTVIYLLQVWQNNRDIPAVSRDEVLASFEAAVEWLEANRTRILSIDNPALWRMVQRSANLTGDARLLELFDQYHDRYKIGRQKNSYWRLLFQKNGWVPVVYNQIESLDDYQQLFVYAITCDSDLAEIPLIKQQTDPAFCDSFPFRPSCVTHQMVGFQLLQERECGDKGTLDESMHKLQLRVRNQLTWDPRLLDQYIQRVLMLLDTGAAYLVKAVWVHRIIEGSQEGGGWSPNCVIIDLPGNNDLILTRNFIGLGQSRSSFHATAQGLLVMANLLVYP